MDKMFYYCLSSMVCKHIVIPGSGFVYRLTKGIATGHPFTSLVNTTVAYCTFATALNKVCSYSELCETRLFVAGDDVIGVIPLSVLEKLSYEICNNSGMKIDPIEDHCGPLYSNVPTIQRSFLKKKFTPLGVAWNDVELIDNLYTSTNGYKNSIGEINRIIDMLMNGPCDFILNNKVLRIVRKHLSDPRIRGPSYYTPFPMLHNMPKYKYSKNFFHRDPKTLYGPIRQKTIIKRFNARLKLAFRWFNMGQPFPGLGYKDDSYWIDATKELCSPVYAPFFMKLKLKLHKFFGVKWYM
jgi:hypothetical protein